MIGFARRFEALLDGQYREPHGLLGAFVGRRMIRQHEPETRWAVSLLAPSAGERVLDIGCGAGRAIELLSAREPETRVTGVDLSVTMLAAARRRNRRAVRQGRVRLRQADAMQLPFADASFDEVLSIHSIYFWSDRRRALAEIARVLRPDGRLALLLSTGRLDDGPGPWDAMLGREVLPIVEDLGFTKIAIVPGPRSRQFKIVALVGTR